MSATEILRRMLDERGVEWERGLPTETIVREPIDALYVERPDGRMHVYFRSYLTPEQAISATLGCGTCKPREVRSRFSKTQEYVTYHCECGHELGGYMTAELPFPHTYNEDKLPNYCPNCGRRIVDPTTNDVDAEVDA